MIPTISFPMLIAGVTFCSICLGLMALHRYVLFLRKKKVLLGRIMANAAQWTPQDTVVQEEAKESQEGLARRLVNALTVVGQKASRGITEQEYSAAKLKFLRAGIQHPRVVPLFWGIRTLLSAILALGFLGLEVTFNFILDTTWTVGLALILALIGFYLPELWLRLKRSKRVQELERGFPDALDLLVVCVEAGMGLDGAINRVAREISLNNPALSQELRMVTMEIKAGKSRQEALNNLAARTDLDDVKNFVGLMTQTIRFGTSIADTLRIYSDTFRTSRRQRAEERAAKLPLKLIFPCALFIFPALFVVILGPAVIQIFETLIK